MNSSHAYDMLMQYLNTQMPQGEEDRDKKAEDKANALKAKADAKGTTTTRGKAQSIWIIGCNM